MCASSLILLYHVLSPGPCGVGCGGCDCADGVHDDYGAGVHNDDVSLSVSLSVGDQPLVDRTLRGVPCTPHTARQINICFCNICFLTYMSIIINQSINLRFVSLILRTPPHQTCFIIPPSLSTHILITPINLPL